MRTTIAVLLVLACAGYVWNVERRMDVLEEAEVGEMKTTWVSGGVVREVRTVAEPGETPMQHEERHFALVRAKRIEYPPDGE